MATARGDGDRLKSEVLYFITRLEHMQGILRLEKLRVRLIDYLPAWSLIFVNPTKDNGVVYVELATYRSHPSRRPSFAVRRNVDYELFQQLYVDFEQMWQDAIPAWEATLSE